ncbi:DUF7210 family protein [Serratia fonticola]|uniref:DUF7210 family protein n=1 Tax=Serratia fonticola TaxID=47917 RepID=UPI003AAB3625
MQEKVTFIKPHTHQGKRYPVGESTNVSPEEATWLRDQCVIQPKAPGKSKPATTKPEQENNDDQQSA